MCALPRKHLYCFAHQALPTLGMQDPNAMFGALCMSEPSERLALVWNYTGSKIEPSQRMEFPELTCASKRRGDHVIAVIQFPQPLVQTEPFFSAFVFGPVRELEMSDTIGIRYFLLEYAEWLDAGQLKSYAILGEWMKDTHLNYGPCIAESADAFGDVVSRKTASQS